MRITRTGLDLEAMFRDAKYGSTGRGAAVARQMDFRFQLVEDRSWLFAHAIEPGGRCGAYVDSIRVGGQPPKRVDVLEDAAPGSHAARAEDPERSDAAAGGDGV